jgi:hypothetical protein
VTSVFSVVKALTLTLDQAFLRQRAHVSTPLPRFTSLPRLLPGLIGLSPVWQLLGW